MPAMPDPAPPAPAPLGVVIVLYDSADVILDCLATLFAAAAADGTALRVAVVDNASTDGGAGLVTDWAAGRRIHPWPADLPFPAATAALPGAAALSMIPLGVNGGFAAGVNAGLARLFADPAIGRVWILNPDSLVPPGTPAAFASHDPGPFALMGGRVAYCDPPDTIQIDGGLIDRRSGITHNANQFRPAGTTALPAAAALDFITGASMVASRAFYAAAGPMAEEYFLYYEEVDWALRRGDLPLAVAPGAFVYHRAGTAIGSPAPGRPASPFSLYFKHRGRMRFVRRHLPRSLPLAWGYTLLKAAQFRLKGWRAEARALMAGARDRPPPPAVRDRLAPEAAARAFAPPG